MKLNSDSREIAWGLMVSASAKIFAVACSYALNFALAQMLGSAQLGIFSLAFTVIVSTTFVARLGLDYVMLRHSALFWTANKKEILAAWYRKSMHVVAVSSFLAMLCMLLLARPLALELFNEQEVFLPLVIMALAIIPQTLLFIQAETLKGAGFIRASQVLQGDGGGVAVYGAALCLCVPLACLWGVVGACLGFMAASWLAFFLGVRLTPAAFRNKGKEKGPTGLNLVQLGLPLFFASIMSLIVAKASIIMLGIWETASAVGIFAISYKMALLGSNIQTACCTIMGPRIAAIHSSGNSKELARYYRRGTLFSWAISFCVLGLLIAASPLIMELLGPDFAEGVDILRLLALGELIMLFFGPVSIALIVTGHSLQHCKAVIIAAVVMLVAGGVLIPVYGIIGAVAAAAAGSISQSFVQALYIKRYLGFFPCIFRFGFL